MRIYIGVWNLGTGEMEKVRERVRKLGIDVPTPPPLRRDMSVRVRERGGKTSLLGIETEKGHGKVALVAT